MKPLNSSPALCTLSKRWYPRAPRKFNANLLINDVHQALFGSLSPSAAGPSQSHIRLLIESEYFERVLWHYFGEDVSLRHIELMVVLLIASNEDKSPTRMEHLVQNQNFDIFINRLIQTTSKVTESANFRVFGYITRIISVLVHQGRHVPDVAAKVQPLFDLTIWSNLDNFETLFDKDTREEYEKQSKSIPDESKHNVEFHLKNRWIYGLLTGSAQILTSSEKANTIEFQYFVENLLWLLTVRISNPESKDYFTKFYDLIQFVPFILIHKGKFAEPIRISSLCNVLIFFEQKGRDSTYCFDILQQSIFNLYPERCPEVFSKLPSAYDIDPTKLDELLSKFATEELTSLITRIVNLNPGSFLSNRFQTEKREIITQIIKSRLFAPEMTPELLENFNEIVFDSSVSLSSASDSHLNLSPGTFPLNSIWDKKLVINLKLLAQREISTHILNVLKRMDVDHKLSFKGKSKYFFQVKEFTSLQGSDYAVDLNRNFDVDTEFVALIELVLPNKLAKEKRVQKFGLNLVRLGRVVFSDKQKSLNLKCTEPADSLEERVRYIIAIPRSAKLNLLNSLNQIGDFSQCCYENVKQMLNHPPQKIIDHETENNKKQRTLFTSSRSESDLLESILSSNYTIASLHKFSGIESVLVSAMSLLKSERSIIIAPSDTFVRRLCGLRGSDDFSFVGYGIQEELKEIEKHAFSCMNQISQHFDNTENKKDALDINSLDYYEFYIKSTWNDYLTQCSGASEDILKNYPFAGKQTFRSFKAITKSYLSLLGCIQFLRDLTPIWQGNALKRESKQIWKYLFTKFNPVISIEEFVILDMEYSITNVFLIDGSRETLALIAGVNQKNLKRLVGIGGSLANIPQIVSFNSTELHNVRNEFITGAAMVENNFRPFNPGFKYNSQLIECKTIVDEAEYSVTLFQYMVLLGYPVPKIGIWVSSEQQQALVSEIIDVKLSNKDRKAFPFGKPQVILNDPKHAMDFSDYAIITLGSGDISSGTPGRLGNYYIGQKQSLVQALAPIPEELTLQICAGENYKITNRKSGQEYSIEDQGHLQEYVDQMTAARAKQL